MATIAEFGELAGRYYQSGNLQQAEALYRQILKAEPAHAAAHHMLGLVAHQTGRHQDAITLIRQAIALDPSDPGWHSNLGLVLMSHGQPAEAIACYREALRINPHHAQAYNNLGNALKGQGQLDDAALCFRQLLELDPTNAKAHYNLGNALKDQGQTAEAALCYRRALASNPNYAQAYNNLGIILKSQGKLAEAIICYRQALCTNPRHVGALNNLAIALASQGQRTEAIASFRQALAINPQQAEAYLNLGNALREQGQLPEALTSYRQALAINPQYADAYNNLGVALTDQGRFAEALEFCRQALQINPQHADAHHSLSVIHMRLGQLPEAWHHNEQALRIDPAHNTALWQRAVLRLQQGDFEGAWHDYEQRWALRDRTPRCFPQPLWDGSSLNDKTILVHAEQGLGDTIQFVRYLPLVKEHGGTVLFECQPALLPLLTGVSGADQVVARDAPQPPFDLQVPLLSLPGVFRTTPATIPAAVPYLRADAGLVEYWRKELAPLEGFRIGIAWQGNPDHRGDRNRSLALTHFEALARVDGAALVSLQKGPGAEQLPSVRARFPILDLGDRIDKAGAFLDTAAIMMNLDLVVTVDSAVAHLAGALGVPVWVALTVVPDWRWLLERADSPWYPTMRLFRQCRFGEWDAVFAQVAAEIRAIVGARRA